MHNVYEVSLLLVYERIGPCTKLRRGSSTIEKLDTRLENDSNMLIDEIRSESFALSRDKNNTQHVQTQRYYNPFRPIIDSGQNYASRNSKPELKFEHNRSLFKKWDKIIQIMNDRIVRTNIIFEKFLRILKRII